MTVLAGSDPRDISYDGFQGVILRLASKLST